ncbi:hypothetical protein E2C01_054699 [Portunus trituberculatus]|uniref:Uncharacterized protein n=1 Tax=Portunus trituberculatus TaxID=210409 RepID=A0A5B7GVQ2_PORTR|nr:hypothetical protein [Portunus trituberculatus]
MSSCLDDERHQRASLPWSQPGGVKLCITFLGLVRESRHLQVGGEGVSRLAYSKHLDFIETPCRRCAGRDVLQTVENKTCVILGVQGSHLETKNQ